MLLFFEGKWDRPHRVEQGIIFGLQDISLRLAASGVLLNAEVNSEIPDWGEWVIAASKRRTILAAHQVLWIWSLLRGYPPFACRELGFMPSPAPKVLWQSRGNDWQHLYEDWMTRWQGGPHRLEELQALGPEVETDTRTQMWLEEADEFGVLLMSEGICITLLVRHSANITSKFHPLESHWHSCPIFRGCKKARTRNSGLTRFIPDYALQASMKESRYIQARWPSKSQVHRA